HGAVAQVDVLDVAAARRVGLEAHRHFEVGTVEAAMLGEDVADATGGFAAHRHAAVTGFEVAILYHDVLAGNVDAPAIFIAAGFHRDAIVAVAEGTILDEHVGAGIGIATVGVRALRDDGDAADGDVGAIERMQHPHGGVEDAHAFDQNIFAAARLDH